MADPVASLTLVDEPTTAVSLLTIPGGIGLYRKRVEIGIELPVGQTFSAHLKLADCTVRLGSNGDSFLGAVLPGQTESKPFDVGIRWDGRSGVSFEGGAAFDVTVPLHAAVPFVKLKALHLSVAPQFAGEAHLTVEVSIDADGSLLDIIAVSVERIGIAADVVVSDAPRPDYIKVGPLMTAVKFKPPTGAGMSVNLAGIVDGGGFLSIDSERGRYAGVLSLQLLGLAVTAIGVVNTKPDLSVLAIISARFGAAGIDVGFGFTINAVGGIFGLNRGVDLHALADAVRSNAISSLMFPKNPIEDAPRIINDLSSIFPALQDHFVLGPMFELGWGKPTGMFTLALGVIIQIPDLKIAIVGILKVLVPPGVDQAPLRLQVNFVGSIDFAAKFFRFDASLFDSRLILYTLEGDMVARLRWGDNATFAIAVGGFHPRYVPAADLDIPPLKRTTINLIPGGDNPRLRIESYYAATSNSLQHGAKVDLYAAAGGFGIRGHLGYDVLVQVSPLHFDASFGGEIAVFAGGEDILSLQIDLQLSGPSPWHVDGQVKFKILFIKITVGVHATFGSSDTPALPEVDVAQLFRDQFAASANWAAVIPAQSHLLVALVRNRVTRKDEVVAHPSGTIEFNQNLVPLELNLERFGAAKPKGDTFFALSDMTVGGNVLPVSATEKIISEFAPGQYRELTNDQKMSAPAFQNMPSGIRASGAALVSFTKAIERPIGYRSDVIDEAAQESVFAFLVTQFDLSALTAVSLLGGSALGRSQLYDQRRAALPTGNEIRVESGGYRVVHAATMEPAAASSSSHVYAVAAMHDLVAANPALAGALVVVGDHELV